MKNKKFDKSTLEICEIWANRFKPRDHVPSEQSDPDKQIEVLGIDWACNLGWGRYELFFKEDGTKIIATSEHMDSNDNKDFLRALLEKICDMAEIVE